MNPKYMPILYDEAGNRLVTLKARELKREAEEDLQYTRFPYDYAEIKTIYTQVKGGEAVER